MKRSCRRETIRSLSSANPRRFDFLRHPGAAFAGRTVGGRPVKHFRFTDLIHLRAFTIQVLAGQVPDQFDILVAFFLSISTTILPHAALISK